MNVTSFSTGEELGELTATHWVSSIVWSLPQGVPAEPTSTCTDVASGTAMERSVEVDPATPWLMNREHTIASSASARSAPRVNGLGVASRLSGEGPRFTTSWYATHPCGTQILAIDQSSADESSAEDALLLFALRAVAKATTTAASTRKSRRIPTITMPIGNVDSSASTG